ncbi:MAG: hypothetical protein PVI86_09750 [Phycisphaerae bacterium]
MRNRAILTGLVVSSASAALAGTVEFTPSDQTVAPGLVWVTVGVETAIADLVGIDSTDLVIGSDLPVVSFTYADPLAFETAYASSPPGIYTHNIYAGASNTRPDAGGDSHLIVPGAFPVTLGTLVVDASSAADGDYTIWVDTVQDECSGIGATVSNGSGSVVVSDPLSGNAAIRIRGGIPATSAEPPCETSLSRAHGNCMRITFDAAVPAPNPGDIKIQRLLPGGAFDGTDLSAQFNFDIDPPNVLNITEKGDVFANGEWYAVHNPGTWAGVAAFKVDYRVVYGDVDNDNLTGGLDAGEIWGFRGPTSDSCNKYDLDEDGTIGGLDAGEAWGYRGSSAPEKPSGHKCRP